MKLLPCRQPFSILIRISEVFNVRWKYASISFFTFLFMLAIMRSDSESILSSKTKLTEPNSMTKLQQLKNSIYDSKLNYQWLESWPSLFRLILNNDIIFQHMQTQGFHTNQIWRKNNTEIHEFNCLFIRTISLHKHIFFVLIFIINDQNDSYKWYEKLRHILTYRQSYFKQYKYSKFNVCILFFRTFPFWRICI